MPARPRPVLRALWRGTRTAAIAVLGLAPASAAYMRGGVTAAALLAICGFFGAVMALGLLYGGRRPLGFRTVPLSLGALALLVLYGVGVIAARDIAMTRVGTDADAVVARTWTTQSRGRPHHHCTLRRTDGTPIPHEYGSNCEGHEPGDTLPVVLDPQGRFAPIAGPKEDIPVAGQLQVAAGAGLVLLLSIAIGSPPRRP
ncbi:hypothetical protein [Actinomadura sp. 7K534]|uniref:hypothetical protein n=1 Tax=Actinomadura sp. 7K534 TaxID=2530366 RepID=UPI00104EA180|nr:hypothetical protein [Actinomadura sp. 7K534]TDB84111.1 hypothetical protein E1266_37015 [Actinomadura sp. 7K534]